MPLFICVLRNKMNLDMQSCNHDCSLFGLCQQNQNWIITTYTDPQPHCLHKFEVTWGTRNHPFKVYGFIYDVNFYSFVCMHTKYLVQRNLNITCDCWIFLSVHCDRERFFVLHRWLGAWTDAWVIDSSTHTKDVYLQRRPMMTFCCSMKDNNI